MDWPFAGVRGAVDRARVGGGRVHVPGLPATWRRIAVALLLTALALPLVAAALAAGRDLALDRLAQALVVADAPPDHLDAVAIHGGGDSSAERERPAVALVRAGRADRLVALGGALPAGDPDLTYAGATVRRLRERGAADLPVERLEQGYSTWGELLALRQLAVERGWTSLGLATSPWHARRVAILARRAFAGTGVRWSLVVEPTSPAMARWWASPRGRVLVLGEWLKVGLALLTAR